MRWGLWVREAAGPLGIFALALALRYACFSGFVLGDDAEEFPLFQRIFFHGPNLAHQLDARFMIWFWNILSFAFLGVSEFSFFLPTVLMSACFGSLGYFILRKEGYRLQGALWAGAWIASAPFEVLLGGLRANDLILSWFLALGLWGFLRWEERPYWQGFVLALALWCGFYVKLWVVYLLPVIGIYYLVKLFKHREWKGVLSFTLNSFVLHGATCLFWKKYVGTYFPFFSKHAATYPIPPESLEWLFWQYPKLIGEGSEFGTTLFGAVPYLLMAGLLFKGGLHLWLQCHLRVSFWDRLDLWLVSYYGSFFLWLNFFPNSFTFDQYYSAPRIFRYLAPLSFPMTLHTAKLCLDCWGWLGWCSRLKSSRVSDPLGGNSWAALRYQQIQSQNLEVRLQSGGWVAGALGGFLLILNLFQVYDATLPTRLYRQNLQAVISAIRQEQPPQVITDAWLAGFFSKAYLKDQPQIVFPPLNQVYHAHQHEAWLQTHQSDLPQGSLLLTGLSYHVFYSGWEDGFRLSLFKERLSEDWKLFQEFGRLNYLPTRERVQLWRYQPSAEKAQPPSEVELFLKQNPKAEAVFQKGMELFLKDQYVEAQKYYLALLEGFPQVVFADDAMYHYVICFFRQEKWLQTIEGFNQLIERYPSSKWVAGAYYHRGVAQIELGQYEKAQQSLNIALTQARNDSTLINLSQMKLQEIPSAVVWFRWPWWPWNWKQTRERL